ncbi:MAG: hypothetical protein KME64_32035 [Scytonematopsis contorta HA4267-MV1]|jgi:hypothetical protein|nr:hypothetical protein [Scytonematopsis contorta HA4267-MV1]
MVGRKKLGRTSLHARVSPETPNKLKAIAEKLGYTYSDDGSIGQLFDAIASGELLLLHQSFSLKLVDANQELIYNIKCGDKKLLHNAH